MKNINVTIMCARMEEFPRCRDLLESCPAVSIIAQPETINEEGAWMAIGRSDILILDEAALERDGLDWVRGLQATRASVKSLLIVENNNRNNILTAISQGIMGVIARDSLFSELTRALTAIYLGEAWVSRALVELIRDELVYRERLAHWAGHSRLQPGWDRMN
jgi:DNA-binding NarL/FixJ family response regulator